MVIQVDPDETNFTISIDHKRLTTTEFLLQIALIRFENLQISNLNQDFRRPGHVFPLIGVEGGVLRRAGHTEAALDLAN